MPLSPLPGIILKDLTQVTPALLRSRNIRLLMLDFDNTIVPYTTTVPTPEMETWLRDMNALADIQICIVSNSHNDRVPKFCRERGLDVITHAQKPTTKGINETEVQNHVNAHTDTMEKIREREKAATATENNAGSNARRMVPGTR